MGEEPHKERLRAFVSQVIDYPKKPGRRDVHGITVDEGGNVVGRHTAKTERDVRLVLLGSWVGSPWLDEYDKRFPNGWTIDWVDHPEKDPEVAELDERFKAANPPEPPTGPDIGDPDGDVSELFDPMNNLVERGAVCWELKGEDPEKLKAAPAGKLERDDYRELRRGARVFSDPVIVDATPTEKEP